MGPKKHSDFSASASHRWLNCPASVRLSKNLKAASGESRYSVEGTLGHEVLEFIARRFNNLEIAKKEAARKFSTDARVKKYNLSVPEMVEHAGASAKIIYDLRPSPDAKLLIETRVDLKHLGPGMFGTLDYAWVEKWGELTVIDYKYGAGVPVLPVDDETKELNPQLMYYAAGVAAKYNFDFSHVKLAIIQPRVWSEGESPLSVATDSMNAIRDFQEKIKSAVQAAKNPATPPRAGESWCRWCPAASFCPAISKLQLEDVNISFDVEKGIEPNTMPAVDALDANTLPKVLDACDLLDVWIEKVRAHAYLLACEGQKIEGRKLVEKRSVRYWVNDAEAAAQKTFGERAFSKPALLSPAQLEKALGKDAKDFTARYTDNKSSGYTLVKASDRRQEVSPTSAFEVDEPGRPE